MADPVPIAVAALVREGRVLMVHRHPERRWYPDCCDLVGGHIEPGETPAQAVIRECAEEIGVRVSDPRPFPMAFADPGIAMSAFLVTEWVGEPVNTAPRRARPVAVVHARRTGPADARRPGRVARHHESRHRLNRPIHCLGE